MECEILEKITGKGTVGVQESGQILTVDVSGWEDKKYEIFLEAEVTLLMEGCSVMWRLLFHISIWNWINRRSLLRWRSRMMHL